MFFGLTNSPVTFQTMMNTIFCEQIARGTLTVYMDDIAVHTKPEEGETESQHLEQHRKLVKEMLTILEEHDLFVNVDKCHFEQESIEFLGVHVGRGQVEMQTSKVDKVRDWKAPRNVQEVRRFLGFTGYYRYFIKGYSMIARPLIELTKKATPWHWGSEQNKAFETLKARMCEKPVLQQPNFDKTFYLQTDASTYGVGAVLSQEGEGSSTHKPKRHPIAYYSSTFTPTEQNYNIFEREFLGVKKALANWRLYLIWTKEPFIIETDHENLTYWKSPRKLSGRTARWYEELQDYNFKIVHIPGKSNVPADALSHPDGEDVQKNEKEVALIPPEAFVRVFDADSEGSLESRIVQTQ
jgi:hypothetical protein